MNRRYAIIGMVMLGCLVGVARAQETVALAKNTLENAHTLQGEILQRLEELASSREAAGGTGELVATLQAVYRKQTSLVRNLQVWRVESLQNPDAKDPSGDLIRYQREIHQEYSDWQLLLSRMAGRDQAQRQLRQLDARAGSSPAATDMEEVVNHLEAEHVSQALGSAESSADELARLLQMLELAIGDPQKLREKQLSEVQEIANVEKNIRSRLKAEKISRTEWRSLRHEQSELRERLKLLTFKEAGLSDEAAENVNEAYEKMGSAENQMLRRRQEGSLENVDAAITALDKAVDAMERMATGNQVDPETIAPPSIRRKEQKQGIMPTMLGAGGEGLDRSPGAMIAADIALLVKLKRRQKSLYEETTGARPAKPLAARRQMDYAADLPQLARRVDRYLPEASALISEAQAAMVASYESLKADEKDQSIPHQELALDRMDKAEDIMRAWWKELLETLDKISAPGGQAPSHGAAQNEEKAKEDLLMILMREIVRVGRLIKTLETEIARVEGWSQQSTDTIDPAAVQASVEAHYALKATGLDIFEKLVPLGGEASSLPEAVMEASQFIEGAGDILKENNYNVALERDRAAMEFLTNAWVYLAQSMASMEEGKQADEGPRTDEHSDETAKMEDGEAVAGGQGDGSGRDGRWDWELSEEARDVIEQSQAGTLPPQYESAIKQYYQRLSERRAR